MPLHELLTFWDSQPQQGDQLDLNAVNSLGLCGGFITDGSSFPPANVLIGTPPTFATGTIANQTLRAKPSIYGLAGEWFDNGGSPRNLEYRTGSPNSREFTFIARVRVNVAIGASGVIARTGAGGSGGTTIPLWRNGSNFDMRISGTDYTAAGTWTLGRWYDVEIVGSASSCILYVDGVPTISGGAATSATIDSQFAIGDVGGGSVNTGDVEFMHILWFNRGLPEAARSSIRSNPWQLFKRNLTVPYQISSGNATANGATVTATASILAGSAAGEINAIANGVILESISSLIAGSASGTVDATATGVNVTATASFISGTAESGTSATASGMLATASATILPGTADGVINSTVNGIIANAMATLLGGSASGNIITANNVQNKIHISISISI